ncbi:unnamed protein product [Adineta ricciae]|uniref:Uncharacterized protein n=1 Tax=Adineta ricciae TaxID=249248 RepID=A0A815WUA4_ADIRI|nr:unnamed protein product [Adineta ricciae]CAF1545212.1 unnamed protein product [Adineta ricciae]
MDSCEFTYIGRSDSQPKHALGIERSWDELKAEFGRSGPGLPGAIYFKTISVEGPTLFAVVDGNTVLYHEHDKWYHYITAKDVKFGMLNTDERNPARATIDKNYLDDKKWSVTYNT